MNSWLTRILCAVVQLVATCGQIQPLATCPANAHHDDHDQPPVCSKSLGLDARVHIEPKYGGECFTPLCRQQNRNRRDELLTSNLKPKQESSTRMVQCRAEGLVKAWPLQPASLDKKVLKVLSGLRASVNASNVSTTPLTSGTAGSDELDA